MSESSAEFDPNYILELGIDWQISYDKFVEAARGRHIDTEVKRLTGSKAWPWSKPTTEAQALEVALRTVNSFESDAYWEVLKYQKKAVLVEHLVNLAVGCIQKGVGSISVVASDYMTLCYPPKESN